jgi:hypothetical protein
MKRREKTAPENAWTGIVQKSTQNPLLRLLGVPAERNREKRSDSGDIQLEPV